MDLNQLMQALQAQRSGLVAPQYNPAQVAGMQDQADLLLQQAQSLRSQPAPLIGGSGAMNAATTLSGRMRADRDQKRALEQLQQAYNAQSGIDAYAAQMKAIDEQMQKLRDEELARDRYAFEQENKAFKPDAEPTIIRSLKAAGIDPLSPEGRKIIQQNLTKANTSYNVTPPAGYTFADPTNPAAGFKVIPGSPQEREIAASDAKAEESKQTQVTRAKNVLETIDRVMGNISSLNTGLPGQLTDEIGGTQAKALAGDLNTIKANLGFDRLTQMREESKTGGALGQVSNIELQLLTSAVANIDNTLAASDLKDRLNVVRRHYSNFIDSLNGKVPNNYKTAQDGGKTYVEIDGQWYEM